MAADLPEDNQLKRRARRRLIGAIALVLLAVIVLPMIFDAEKKPLDQDVSVQIPNQDTYVVKPAPPPPVAPKDAPAEAPKPAGDGAKADAPAKDSPKAEAPAKAETLAKDAAPVTKAEPAPKAADAPAKAEAKPEPKPEPKAAAKEAAKAAPEPAKAASKVDEQWKREQEDAARAEALLNGKAPAPKSEKAAVVASGSFAVQVGAFSTDEKVQEVRDKLSSAGLKSYVEKVPTKDGSVTRVRAGPYPSKDAAEAALGKVSGLGFGSAKVVSR